MKQQNNISPIRQKIEQIIFGFEQPSDEEISSVLLKNRPDLKPTVTYIEQDSTAHVAFRSMN